MAQFSRFNALDQILDIQGSFSQSDTRTLTDETSGFGAALSGQTGGAATIAAFGAGVSTITGLTGMTANSVGNFLTVSGAATVGNNGTFLIITYNSANSVDISNASGASPDANDGSIVWTERAAYCLNDDLDFERTDRSAIKGVAYDQPIPVYERPSAVGTDVPANLSNIAGKTLDAFARCVNRGAFNQVVESTLLDLYGTGVYKHADAVDERGVPVFDAAPFTSDWTSCYVEVTNPADGNELTVMSGPEAGNKIFGISYAGVATSPDQVEIHWYSAPPGTDISATGVAYTWEQGTATANTGNTTLTVVAGLDGAMAVTGMTGANVGNWVTFSGFTNGLQNDGTFVIISVESTTDVTVQNHLAVSEGPTATVQWDEYLQTQPTSVNLVYGYNQRLDELDQNVFRFPLVSGLTSDADLRQDINDIQEVIGITDGDTFLTGLTNTGNYYPFVNLPDASPSVTEALNTLNAQIGDRNYTGPYLTDGQTITASLQALSNAVSGANVVRYIERLSAVVLKNTSHLLPGGATYVLDGTDNGMGLSVYTRGVLRDPGSVAGGNDYAETDTTHVTFYADQKAGDHINYYVYG